MFIPVLVELYGASRCEITIKLSGHLLCVFSSAFCLGDKNVKSTLNWLKRKSCLMFSHWINLSYLNFVSFRNPMYGKCIKNGAGSFFLLVIASENSMKTSSTKQRWGFPLENTSMYFPTLLGISNRLLKSPKLCALWSTKALFLMTELCFYFLLYLLWEQWSKEQWKITATLENKPTTCTHNRWIPIHNMLT